MGIRFSQRLLNWTHVPSCAWRHGADSCACDPPHKRCAPSCTQDEFKFYLEDASSKLLVVPRGGNASAEAAAQQLGVPVASFVIPGGVQMS